MSFRSEPLPGLQFDATYGYLFWSSSDAGDLYGRVDADVVEPWCAIGAFGQDICIDRKLGRVSVQQRDMTFDGAEGNLVVSLVAMDPALSFSPDGTTATNGDLSDSGTEIFPSSFFTLAFSAAAGIVAAVLFD